VRVCLVYDRLYPLTLGGAERWLTDLGQRLSAAGHDVSYLTLRHWDRSVTPDVPGVRVVTRGPRIPDYTDARRTLLPPLVFGWLVFWHLLRHGRRYDVVHSVSFPYFSVLAAGILRPLLGYRLVVDWFEVWTRDWWREYAGRLVGALGWRIQRLCIAVTQHAFCFSRLHLDRLREEGYRGQIDLVAGLYAQPIEEGRAQPAQPVVVYAGRHIPEKRVPALVRAMAVVHERAPELHCEIYGDGPEREEVVGLVQDLGLDGVVQVRGFVATEEVDAALRRGLCMVLPSRREGYGLVVVEAAARGTPSVVVDEPDNAAVELVEDGVNGFVASSASPEDLSAAILHVLEAGDSLRASTADWFARNASRLSLSSSLEAVVASYGAERPEAAVASARS
jgi:glycosyltransferase involved in cell wall biosynthesis